jgi:hypothetical protein
MNYGEHFNFGPVAFYLTYFNLWSLVQSNNFALIANDMFSNLCHFNIMAKAHKRNLTKSGGGQPTNSQCAACTASCHVRWYSQDIFNTSQQRN